MQNSHLDRVLQGLRVSAGPFAQISPATDWQPLYATGWPSLLVAIVGGAVELNCPFTGTHVLREGMLVALRCSRAMMRDASYAQEGPGRVVLGGFEPLIADGNPWISKDGAILRADIAGTDLFRTVSGELVSESVAGLPGATGVVDCVALRMFITLLRAQPSVSDSELHDDPLRQVADRLRTRLAESHPIEKLVSLTGMSRTAFLNAFSQRYGTSPLGYLTKLRMDRAALLLSATENSIKAVGLQLGYRSRSSFWTAFKAAHGVDPSGYRERVRGGDAPSET